MFLIVDIVNIFFEVMSWLIIIRVILSWIPHNPYNSVLRFIYEVTEIILGPIRKLIPMRGIPVDFSPIIAILLIQAIQSIVLNLIYRLLF